MSRIVCGAPYVVKRMAPNAWTQRYAAAIFLNMPRSPKPDPALAAALRRLREDRGLTREALAYNAGITTASLARIELAQSTPGWDTIRKLVDALKITISRLAAAVEAAEEGGGTSAMARSGRAAATSSTG
jgi:DNA-binding XRE family transcriptional regulator